MSTPNKSKRKRRSCELHTSSDEEPIQEEAQNSAAKRHSERIEMRRRQRPKFHLPPREKVWDSIPSESSPLKHKSPRKTVSDFTKVYNTYNFDDFEDTSDDGMENFLTESSGNSSDNSLSDDGKKHTGTRLKNYHRRIRIESSSSDNDSGIKGDNCRVDTHKNTQISQNEHGASKGDSGEVKAVVQTSSKGEGYEEGDVVLPHDCNEHDNGGDSDEMTPYKRRRNVSLLDSDDEDDEDSGTCGQSNAALNPPAETVTVQPSGDEDTAACEESNAAMNNAAETVTVDCEGGSSSDSESSGDGNTAACAESNAAMKPTAETVTVDSEDGSSSDSESSSGDEDESRASRLRRKSREVFQQFKEAQAKKKLSLESKSK